mmetsp:Transcript_18707/g.41816  ORF Transcript_18707/g.41816 Transcript_18707/m.41816 type:complete len:520 (+) Transcript_18707:1954-3513(+)
MSSRVFSCSLRFSDSWSSSLSCTVCSWPSRSCSRSTSRSCETVSSSTSALRPASSSDSRSFSPLVDSDCCCSFSARSRVSASWLCSPVASEKSLSFCSVVNATSESCSSWSRASSLSRSASVLSCFTPTSMATLASESAVCSSCIAWDDEVAAPSEAFCSSASSEALAFSCATASSACFVHLAALSCASASRSLFIRSCSPTRFCCERASSRSVSSSWPISAFLSVTLSSHFSRISPVESRSRSSRSFRPSISLSYVADDFSNSERSVSSSAATAFFSVISSSHWVRQRESCCAISTCSVFLLRISNCSRSICCRCELYTAVSRASASRFFDCSFCSSSFRFLEADFHAISVAAPPCSLPRDVACASAVRASTVRSASRTRECSSTCWSSCPFQCSALPRALFASTSARCISFCTVFAFVSCWSRSTRILFSSSSSAAFSSSAARAMEVQSSRHCNSSSDAGFLSGGGAPSSFGGSASSAVCASYSAMRRRSFSCIAIDHSAFHPSACICRMATSCMNI